MVRQSRFSKIGGETVPHEKIEQLIAEVIQRDKSNSLVPNAAVTAVPDSQKGERLVVIHQPLGSQSPSDITSQLAKMGIPNLWIPRPRDFVEVQELPLTSIGKLDLASLKRIALARESSSQQDTKDNSL